jgi:hypothetical protein
MGIEREPAKGQAIKLVLCPSDGGDSDIRRTSLLREAETESHLVAGFERSLRADSCTADGEIVHQTPIYGRSSQPSPRPDGRKRAREGRFDTDTRMAPETIQHGRPRRLRVDLIALHASTVHKGRRIGY